MVMEFNFFLVLSRTVTKIPLTMVYTPPRPSRYRELTYRRQPS